MAYDVWTEYPSCTTLHLPSHLDDLRIDLLPLVHQRVALLRQPVSMSLILHINVQNSLHDSRSHRSFVRYSRIGLAFKLVGEEIFLQRETANE